MSNRLEIEEVLELYFRGINENDCSIIPLAEDVEMSGPMMPETMRGRSAVRQQLSDTAPFVARMVQKKTLIDGDSAAVIIEFEGLNGVIIEGAEIFTVRNGEICEDHVYFDARPLIRGSN